MARQAYKAIVSYESAPISILDRNIQRIADQAGATWQGHNERKGVQKFAFTRIPGLTINVEMPSA